MTKISKKKISKEAEFINNFWRTVTFLENKEEVRDFLKALLTPTEMLMLAKRIEVSKMLISDSRYIQIHKEVQVTNSMITHTKDSLIHGGYHGFLTPLQRRENADYKLKHKIQKNLKRQNFTQSSLSQQIAELGAKQIVRQYKKWKKFKSAAT